MMTGYKIYKLINHVCVCVCSYNDTYTFMSLVFDALQHWQNFQPVSHVSESVQLSQRKAKTSYCEQRQIYVSSMLNAIKRCPSAYV